VEKTQYAGQLPLDYEAHWPPLKALLSEQLRLLDEGYPNNPHLRLTDGELHLDRLEKGVTPESAQALKNRLRQMLDRRHLSDLLLEVQHWTNFLSGFTRLNSGRPITEEDTAEKVKLLTCLIAEGCNIGFSDIGFENESPLCSAEHKGDSFSNPRTVSGERFPSLRR
jgi:hypothetical protein